MMEDSEDNKGNEDCNSVQSMWNEPDFDFEAPSQSHFIEKDELHDLATDLELLMNKAKLLDFRQQQWVSSDLIFEFPNFAKINSNSVHFS